ncbi:MAG: hypothetical protein M3355_03670 [Actinomycetota bacterium]|nr:hypothetical protein [Actinomycetota bacterium]
MTRITKHIRANIVNYVALFFALSAGAYAAGLVPDSVRSKHIKDGQVRSADVADDTSARALTGGDIANDSLDGFDIEGLSSADFQSRTLTGDQIALNSLGADELGPVATRFGTKLVDPGAIRTVTASCLAGEELLAGGGGFESGDPLFDSQRVGTSNTWTVTSLNFGASEVLTAEAICLTK